MSRQELNRSNRSHTGILHNGGERIVQVGDLCERLGVHALIRLHSLDYALFQTLQQKYAHFNLETTSNQIGKRYAVLPIIRRGYRTQNGEEILPILDPEQHTIGWCDVVLQRVPIDQVSSEFFRYSLPTIQTAKALATALI